MSREISRREAVMLGSAAIMATAVPLDACALADMAVAAEVRVREKIAFHFEWMLKAQMPAWELWKRAGRRFAENIDEARALLGSQDMDALMPFRSSGKVVHFEVAGRRLRRLAGWEGVCERPNATERWIGDVAVACETAMQSSPEWQTMEKLDQHIADLERAGLYAKQHRLFRMQRFITQHDCIQAFKEQYGMRTLLGRTNPETS
jgi:hypothetical protein